MEKLIMEQSKLIHIMKAFVSEFSSRPFCADCKFKGLERPRDITIFDYYKYSILTGKVNDDKGYSSVFVHSDKEKKMLQAIMTQFDEILNMDTKNLVEHNGEKQCKSK